MLKENSKLLLRSTNELLDYLSKYSEVPCNLPTAKIITEELDISRTTANKLINILTQKGIAKEEGKKKLLLRLPKSTDYFSIEEIESSKSDIVEKLVLKKLSSYELKPGDRFSELELAKTLNTNTIVIREVLSKIAQSGIIKKHPRQKWEVVEFSEDIVREIASVRKLYEGYAINQLETVSKSAPCWSDLKSLADAHQRLLNQSKFNAIEVRNLERKFHTTIINASDNRFIIKSYNSIFTLIFFHLGQIEYDQPKMIRVLEQHLDILENLLARNFKDAYKAMITHLEHAEQSMLNVNQELQNNSSAASILV